MKIAVSAQGKTMDSLVDPRFGRASYFILVDSETGEHSYIDNDSSRNAPQGSGIEAARSIINSGAQAILTGSIGPKAFSALRAGYIKMYTGITGTVHDAVEQFKQGELPDFDRTSAENHPEGQRS